jgi:hypothetical protein
VASGIQSGGVSSSIGFNLSLYLESRATPVISASKEILKTLMHVIRSACVNKLFLLRDCLWNYGN